LAANKFLIPSSIVYGPGAVESIGDLVAGLSVKKVLIVTDKVMVQLGNVETVANALKKKEIDYEVFDQVATEPTIDFVELGLKQYRETGCQGLVAVGGGSPIDTAKAISVMSTNSGSIRDYKGLDKLTKSGAPVVAVPTTAGTGSEATRIAVITDEENDVKMMLGSNYMLPHAAIADPMLTVGMPQGLTAATGIDALTHAIEAYVSVKNNPMSDLFALSAIRLISGNLRMAWSNGKNVEARSNMMLGALHGGIAFSNSSVALVHGMARPLGAVFHVPHGVSNAVLLKEVMEFSVLGNPERFAKIAETMGENIRGLSVMDAANKAVMAVDRLICDIKVPTLKDLGIDRDKLIDVSEKMAIDAIDSGSPGNNPRIATKNEIVELYKKVYDAR
jgi:alcohol dehydrogenase class IV